MFGTNRFLKSAAPAGVLAICGAAMGQGFSTGFEAPTYTGSTSGTATTGQDGWYIPSTVGGATGSVFTYTGNDYGVIALATGGGQMEGGECTPALANVIRAQHDVDFSAGGVWVAEFDVNGSFSTFSGAVLPASDNLGSFSLQPSTTPVRYFQQLMNWGSGAVAIIPYPGGPNPVTNWATTGDHFHAAIGYFTDASPETIAFELPSAAWADLPTNHWYHTRLKWSFTTNQILEVAIQDLTAGTPLHVDDVTGRGWFLDGGSASTHDLPTAIRLFTGSAIPGDVVMWDNVNIHPFSNPVVCYPNCDGSTQQPCLNVQDFGCFLNRFGAGDTYANCDGSTTPPILNVQDFGCFLNRFGAGCGTNC